MFQFDNKIQSPKNIKQYLCIVGCSLFLSNTSYAQNVGIGTPTPSHKLHVVGDARISSLSGVGTRMVVADATGVLSTQAIPVSAGDITGVIAGDGLINGGTTGDVTLNVVAVNGLTTNPDDIRLGGPLIQGTTITQGAFSMTHNLNGTGDFYVADNGVNRFAVLDNGRTTVGGVNNAGQFNVTGNSYFSDDIHLRDGAVNGGDILVRIYDLADDGIVDIYENGAYNIRLHGNGPSIFNEQGIGSNDFRIESNTQANMFFIDAGTDEIGIRTATPANMLQMVNGGVNVGANAMASFDNDGAEGVPISGYNTDAANGYNGIEGIVTYSGTAFNAAGVFGLAIDNTLTNSAIGVRGTINGRDGYGVLGTRTNGAGAGWAGLFIEDLGYTGFFGAASDESLKKNIEPIQKALDIVAQLNPVTYDFDLEKHPGMGLNTEMEYGFIAQEVQVVLPEIVREKNLPTNTNVPITSSQAQDLEVGKFMVMDYTRIIPILTQAIKEQQDIIKEQNVRILALEKMAAEK
jgi:hypothetical protein